ncbi:MAG: hypothetical protein JWO31_380 [Phycisphaerales bacterium]|nr:hypothetical protein [Phycisphaerales bacterium]
MSIPTRTPPSPWQRFRQSTWLRVCRFAYRRLMAGDPTRRAPVGLPQMRDPDHRCHAFAPRPWQPGDFRDCQSDGHYLCVECCHLDPQSDRATGGDF